jgi:quercetin dioxygenase-like cupin family protein
MVLVACGGAQEAIPEAPTATEASTSEVGTSSAVAQADLDWQEVPDAGGLQLAVVHQDPETKAMAFFVKIPAGWSHPNHFHPTNFHRVVLEGDMTVTLADGTKVTTNAGDYARGISGMMHSASTTNGATFFVVTDSAFASILVDKDGKPLNEGDPAPTASSDEPIAVAADALAWKDLPGGSQAAVVYENPETGSAAMFLRAKAGFSTPSHTHPTGFHRVTLEGSLTATAEGGAAVTSDVGGYYRGEKDVVHVGSSESGGTIFLVSDGKWGTVPVDGGASAAPQ